MNQPPLNPDALAEAIETIGLLNMAIVEPAIVGRLAIETYLAVAQPEVNSVEELAKAWHAGFCRGEQTAFREPPVNPDTINPYKNGETP